MRNHRGYSSVGRSGATYDLGRYRRAPVAKWNRRKGFVTMVWNWTRASSASVRYSRIAAWILVGLSIFALAEAVRGVFFFDGWHRIAYVTAFFSMGLANLSNASATLLPDGQESRALRLAVTPLV